MQYINNAFWLAPSSMAKTLSSLSCVMWSVEEAIFKAQIE